MQHPARRRSLRLLAALLVVAAVLVALDVRRGTSTSALRNATGRIFGSAESALADAVRPVRDAIDSVGRSSQQQQVADLTAQNADLRRELQAGSEARQVQTDLARLGLMAGAGDVTVVPARVVATGDTTGTERTVDIGAGRDRGLRPGQLVVDADGLVGVLIRVTSSTATVRLAADPRTIIGARLAGAGTLGTVTGTGDDARLTFTLFDPTLPIRPGDRVVTYGSVDYPGGIPIGVTTSSGELGAGAGSLTQEVGVRPYARAGLLDLVGVVTAAGGNRP